MNSWATFPRLIRVISAGTPTCRFTLAGVYLKSRIVSVSFCTVAPPALQGSSRISTAARMTGSPFLMTVTSIGVLLRISVPPAPGRRDGRPSRRGRGVIRQIAAVLVDPALVGSERQRFRRLWSAREGARLHPVADDLNGVAGGGAVGHAQAHR